MAEFTLFGTSDDELLIAAYQRQGRTLDDLPYTEQFEAVYAAAVGAGDADEPLAGTSRADLFHRLHNLRKAGHLPRLGRSDERPPRIGAEAETVLIRLVEAEVGRISLRDRLPYTDAFERIAERFAAETGLSVSHHDLWRIIAKLAK
jgi:hypothetical protein